MASPTKQVQKLQSLGAQIQQAIRDYTEGKTQNTNEIVKQCQSLQFCAESPEVFAERLRYQPLSICALMIAAEGGMLEALVGRGEDGASADQLAQLSKRPKLDIVRALRLLTAIGVCDEVGVQQYRANDKTPVVASKGQIGGLRVSSVPVSAITVKVEDYFSACARGEFPKDAVPSAYEYTYGKTMYDYLGEKEERRADFDAYMTARKKEEKLPWHKLYPVISELSKTGANGTDTALDTSAVTIVDIGGSRGHDLETFIASNPGFAGRLILQDLAETVEPLKREKHAFEVMAYDFFTPQPVVGATIYMLLAVLHNWDDEACRKILRNQADAMRLGGAHRPRLLISVLMLPDVGAERRAAELDMQMWMLQQSRQRTRSELESLVQSVGLEILQVWDNGERGAILETSLAMKELP
ncbi:S-adenosyl-L-methionine-dependent methyltransferase [Xylaria palmicola]|nr:S-adenosyl-L-methionine-dependent methyltransferase [Xylaria palmicola]